MPDERLDAGLNRRPVGLRSARWIQALARRLAARGVAPNTVSIMSMAGAAAGAIAFLVAAEAGPRWAALWVALVPIGVGFRGLCNLLDGLIAIEGGRRTRSGELFNDLPDRVSDILLYAAAGYAVRGIGHGVEWGWAAAAAAVMTAYVRYLGASMGARQYFLGPMAKTHRMAVLVTACVAAAVELLVRGSSISLLVALMVIAVGSVVTAGRRAIYIMHELERD